MIEKRKKLLDNIVRPSGTCGLFDIYLDSENDIVFKKAKKNNLISSHLLNPHEQQYYKNHLRKLQNTPILGKYILQAYDIETDGSYKSRYVEGINLYEIKKVLKKSKDIIPIIKKLQADLNEYSTNYKLFGDWGLHNLIYEESSRRIYNIDIEGFYTYPRIFDNGNCDIVECNKRFDQLYQEINEQL